MSGGRTRRGWLGATTLSVLFAIVPALTLPGNAVGAGRDRLTVGVAVSMAPALRDFAESFQAGHPGTRVDVSAAASGVLLQQALRDAPFDLMIFASGDELDRLAEQGRLEDASRRNIASNRLVILVPRGGAMPLIVHDLIRPEFNFIAIGNRKTAPVGRYAWEALQSLGLLGPLGARLIQGESSRQVLDYVARGEVPAGLLYASDAMLAPDRVVIGPQLPSDSYSPVVYEAALLSGAADNRLAREFLDELASQAGRDLLDRYGFLPPPPEGPE